MKVAANWSNEFTSTCSEMPAYFISPSALMASTKARLFSRPVRLAADLPCALA